MNSKVLTLVLIVFGLLLTALLMPLCILASWVAITQRVKEYMIAFLVLETLMIGVFCALDMFLFYVFWEVMLLPMYFLIGVWGGPRREYAAIKFFLYTLLGSVFILIALLGFYFTDIQDFVDHSVYRKQVETTIDPRTATAEAAEGKVSCSAGMIFWPSTGNSTPACPRSRMKAP